MKSTVRTSLRPALFGLASLFTVACSDSRPVALAAAAPSAAPVPAATPAAAPPIQTPPYPPAIVPIEWSAIQNLGYDDRAAFLAGLQRLHAQLELQISELNARRAALTASDNPGKLNFAMEALGTARTRLLSTSTDLSKATPQNWEQLKERVSDSWVVVQNAHDKAAAEAPR